jgi:hypothetical protein
LTALVAVGMPVAPLDWRGGGGMARPQAPVGAPRTPQPDEDRRKRLEALRDRLADAIEEAGHRDLAPLAARYQSVLAELADLPVTQESDGLDDLSAARRRRRSGTSA